MTTVRKWGVQMPTGYWLIQANTPDGRKSEVFQREIELAVLYDSPTEATHALRVLGGCVVRSVLVTQEEAGWELLGELHEVSNTRCTCVVGVGYQFLSSLTADGKWTRALRVEHAFRFTDTQRAFRAAGDAVVRGDADSAGVFGVRRTEPRETRRAGRTLDELLASVPAEANHDD